MRPNTPHIVYTMDASICLGGHFYAASTLRDTCFGIFQTFVSGNSITNASLFATSRDILIRYAILIEKVLVREQIDDSDQGII